VSNAIPEPATDWVQTVSDGKVVRVPFDKYRENRGLFMLEFWLYPPKPKGIDRAVRTFLWINGPTELPDTKGVLHKTSDELLHECPWCDHIFLPPTPKFREIHPVRGPVMMTVCSSCNRKFPLSRLVDNRTYTGTWDGIGLHLAFRYNQLREVARWHLEADPKLAARLSSSEVADVLRRSLREEMAPRIRSVIDRERYSTDHFWRAEIRNSEECAYRFAGDLARELAVGVTLESFFKMMARA